MAWHQVIQISGAAHGQLVPGQNHTTQRFATQGALGMLPMIVLADRVHLGAGAGVAQVWREGALMDSSWTPVVMVSVGTTVYRRGPTQIGLEVDMFGGGGGDDDRPDERLVTALAATATW